MAWQACILNLSKIENPKSYFSMLRIDETSGITQKCAIAPIIALILKNQHTTFIFSTGADDSWCVLNVTFKSTDFLNMVK